MFTDAMNYGSVLRPTQLKDLAATCDAAVYIVFDRHRSGRGLVASSGDPVFKQALDDVARMTGGRVIGQSDLAGALKGLLNAVRHSYVLAYAPQGVDRNGWHSVTVSVTKPGAVSVRARRGYLWK